MDRYILVTTGFRDGKGDFSNTAVGMVEAYDDALEPLPIEVATLSTIWNRPRDFRTGGLEFDSGLGTLVVDFDANNGAQSVGDSWRSMHRGGCIAFVRGRNEFLPSTPCEAYPEVRKLWAGWIDRILDAGVDGIDLRISAHGSLVDKPFEYGFNELIVKEFCQRYGSEPTGSAQDLEGIAEIRGAHYTSFVRETSERVRRVGKKLQFHLHTEAFRPNPVHGQIMGFPANVHYDWKTWVWEGLIDGATLRTSWFEAWEDPPEGKPNRQRLARNLSDPVVMDAIAVAREAGVPLYLNRYVARAVGTDEYVSDLETIFNDARFGGFDVYEFCTLARATPDGSTLVPLGDRIARIRAKAHELGLV